MADNLDGKKPGTVAMPPNLFGPILDYFQRVRGMQPATDPASGRLDMGINGVAAAVPSAAALGFDPNTLNPFKSPWLTVAMHPLDAWKAREELRPEAFQAQAQYAAQTGRPHPAQTQDNDIDAFRHAYFSMRAAQEFGADEAKAFGDLNEATGQNTPGAHLMDLYNNQMGRALAESRLTGKPANADDVKRAIRDNLLRRTPFRSGE